MQISKRLVGMHPDKVLSALEEHIKAGHEKSSLQAIPDLQLQYPQFHNELEQTKARISAKLADGVRVINRDAAEIFRCVNCGGGLSRQNPESKTVICQYCGCNAEHPAQHIHLERWNQAIDLESNFTIGDFFAFEKQRWQAIGVQVFSGRVKEYDEGEWVTSFSRYSSWWMLNERRELAWLVDDGTKRYWADKYIPQNPSLPSTSDKRFEHGHWQLEFAAGEFSYQPKPGEAHLSSEKSVRETMPVRPGGSSYSYYVSAETRLTDDGKPKEIEFIRSRPVSNTDMLVGLGKGEETLDLKRWKHTIAALAAALPVLLGVHLYLNQGGEVSNNAVDLTLNSTDVPVQSITVDKPGITYQMSSAVGSLPVNTWLGVNFWLEDADGEAVYAKYLEFWRETGVDSDGRWDESKRGITWHARIDEAGTYNALVSVDPESTQPGGSFRFRTEPNRTAITPFIFAGVFSVFLIFLCRSKIAAISSVAASIAVKLKHRFDPEKKPKHSVREQAL